jgi:hypothetical protein
MTAGALLDDLLRATESFLAGRPAEDDMTLLCAHVEARGSREGGARVERY